MPQSQRYLVYGAAGSGSVPVEAALTLLGLPYEVVESAGPRDAVHDPALYKVNPLGQIPTLVLPGGEIMTESAAILIWLADRHPEGKLAPPPQDRRRPGFLRWMAYVAAEIYALAWVRNDPMRLVSDTGQAEIVLARIAQRRAECWRVMDAQIQPGRFLAGNELGVLDLYVATVSRWLPQRRRFALEAPRLADIIRRVDSDPRLAEFWAERFPFVQGWEG
jgi:GST-like protein